MPGLKAAAQSRLKCPPIYLDSGQARVVFAQFQETAVYRGWQLEAAAIMANHTHVVVSLRTDVDPHVLLRDFKSYGSRKLNSRWGKPASGTWWTESGSKRKRANYTAVVNAVRYVANQENPLVIWIHPGWRNVLKNHAHARG